MARSIPQNAETREFHAAAVVAYCYESQRGPALLAYKGRQSKPARSMAFVSAEARDRSLASFVEYEDRIEARKRQRQQASHGLVVGDIVYSVWGYEQTNVTFYEVVRVPSSRSATLRELEADSIEDAPRNMTGKSTPKPGQYVQGTKEKTRRTTGWHRLGELSKWDGRPCRVTWYA
jgi:hypothetical protein